MNKLILNLLLLIILINPVSADEVSLLIQPILDSKRTIELYRPLANYLTKQTGVNVKIVTTENFLAYWNMMRTSKYDLVFDAAHFTDFRAKKFNYEILAKVSGTVTYSLITNEKDVLFDETELIAQSVATVTSPSLGGIHLEKLYTNPIRLPRIINKATFNSALDSLKSGETMAAIVPTPMINGDLTVNTILVTEPTPHMAISASPTVNKRLKGKITAALLKVNNLPEWEAMRKTMNIVSFEKADETIYDGYEKLLTGVWGYQ